MDIRVPFRSALLESEGEFLVKETGSDIEHFFIIDRDSRAHKDHTHVVSDALLWMYQSLACFHHSLKDGPCILVLF